MEQIYIDMVIKHDQDLYRGNGLPGMTSRMATVEERQDNSDERQCKVEDAIKQIADRMWLIVIGVAGAAVLTLLNLVLHAKP
jgi:hypothetical protein